MVSSSNKNRIKFIFLLVVIAIVFFLVRLLGIDNLISPNLLREKVLSYGMLAPIAFIVFYSIATIFFLPGTPLTIASGLIFGKFLGTFYTVIGATMGALIAFFIARLLGEKFVEDILKGKYKKIYAYNEKIEKNGFIVVFFLRLVPLFPFNGLNFMLGLTKVKIRDYLIGTALGIIPGSFVLAYFGDSLAMLNVFHIVLSILLFVALALLPFFYKKIKKRKSKQAEK